MPGHDVSLDPRLIPAWTYFVRVCGFTFAFGSVAQIETTLAYYARKIHPSSRLPDSDWLRAEHDVAQRWFERLPQYLLEGPKRRRVIQALQRALTEFSDEANRLPVQEAKASNLPITRPGTEDSWSESLRQIYRPKIARCTALRSNRRKPKAR